MSSKPASDLLYDSEATLRLVDSAIEEMGELDTAEEALRKRVRNALMQGTESPIGLIGLSDLLARGYAEIITVLDSLRQSRNMLEKATVEKLQHTHDKLREVSDATETAATDILNGLERATAMVDDLDIEAASGSDVRGTEIRNQLRDELFMLMGHMQFQDITSQQLNYASAVLNDMEQKLAQIAQAFDPAAMGIAAASLPSAVAGPVTFDPNASTQNREERQAVADDIMAAKRDVA